MGLGVKGEEAFWGCPADTKPPGADAPLPLGPGRWDTGDVCVNPSHHRAGGETEPQHHLSCSRRGSPPFPGEKSFGGH